jgi:hypothetical protein
MARYRSIAVCVLTMSLLCSAEGSAAESASLRAVRTIVEAVNAKDSDLYVSVFADDAVVQMYDGPVRVRGRQELSKNRAQHFLRFPEARSEIQHLVEIGPFVIMHDRVWLHGKDDPASDIVEIFTFENGLIAKVEVMQPERLLSAEPQ